MERKGNQSKPTDETSGTITGQFLIESIKDYKKVKARRHSRPKNLKEAAKRVDDSIKVMSEAGENISWGFGSDQDPHFGKL